MDLKIKINKNTMSFTVGDLFAECYSSPLITEIKEIKEFDRDNGNFVYADNMEDEELICIADIYENLGLTGKLDKLRKNLHKVDKVTIINYKDVNRMDRKQKIAEECDFMIEGLAFFVDRTQKSFLKLKVVDIDNLDNRAILITHKLNDCFSLSDSTFKEGKRKWQMLYLAEVNKQLAYNLWMG